MTNNDKYALIACFTFPGQDTVCKTFIGFYPTFEQLLAAADSGVVGHKPDLTSELVGYDYLEISEEN